MFYMQGIEEVIKYLTDPLNPANTDHKTFNGIHEIRRLLKYLYNIGVSIPEYLKTIAKRLELDVPGDTIIF